MALVDIEPLASMRKQQCTILLRHGYGGLKAEMKPPTPKQARMCAPFPPQPSKHLNTKLPSPNPLGSQFANYGVERPPCSLPPKNHSLQTVDSAEGV